MFVYDGGYVNQIPLCDKRNVDFTPNSVFSEITSEKEINEKKIDNLFLKIYFHS